MKIIVLVLLVLLSQKSFSQQNVYTFNNGDLLNENEITDHFLLSDLFVLPSKKEGFGIEFIEALACGLPVICGNADGSRDAIKNGELGTAINVDDLEELEQTIIASLKSPLTLEKTQHLQRECLLYFDEEFYKKNLQEIMNHESVA